MTTETKLTATTYAYNATQARLAEIKPLPFFNTCKGIETPQSLRDEIAELEQLLPQQRAELDAAYAAHLAANGLTR